MEAINNWNYGRDYSNKTAPHDQINANIIEF